MKIGNENNKLDIAIVLFLQNQVQSREPSLSIHCPPELPRPLYNDYYIMYITREKRQRKSTRDSSPKNK